MAGEPAQRKKPGKHKAGSRPKGSRKEEQRRYQQKKAAKAKADQDPIELGVGGGGGARCVLLSILVAFVGVVVAAMKHGLALSCAPM